MKRSEINAIMHDADQFIRQTWVLSPALRLLDSGGVAQPRATKPARSWKINWAGTSPISALAGIDTDGLFLFTVRNGSQAEMRAKQGKLYCEKIMVVDVDQMTPMHFHWNKVEDIINRGGGKLAIQLYNATPEDGLADTADCRQPRRRQAPVQGRGHGGTGPGRKHHSSRRVSITSSGGRRSAFWWARYRW